MTLMVWMLSVLLGAGEAARDEDLLRAVRAGDTAAVKALLEGGVRADAKGRYDRTALSFAADRGHVEIVKLLLAHGADPNAKDTFYGMTPVTGAAGKGHVEIVRVLLAGGATAVADVLGSGIANKSLDLVDAALATGKVGAEDLSYALERAQRQGTPEIVERLTRAGAVPPPAADFRVDPGTLQGYAGEYRDQASAETLTVSLADGVLKLIVPGRTLTLAAFDPVTFRTVEGNPRARWTFVVESGRVVALRRKTGDEVAVWHRVEARP